MRLMLKFTIPVEQGNRTVADGSMSRAIEGLLEQVKPEAAYFTLQDGKRAGFIIFDQADPARLTAINEPLFAKLNAAIETCPVLTIEDLRKGLG